MTSYQPLLAVLNESESSGEERYLLDTLGTFWYRQMSGLGIFSKKRGGAIRNIPSTRINFGIVGTVCVCPFKISAF